MKSRKGVCGQDPAEAPLTFQDVAAGFSEEEWKLLQRWQKQLYRNVMKEIQLLFSSLGPLIATSVFSLRPKENEDLCSRDLQEIEIWGSISSPSNVTAESDVLFTGNQYLKNSEATDERESHHGHSTGDHILNSEYVLKKEAELNSRLMDPYGAKIRGRDMGPRLEHADVSPDVSFNIKREGEPFVPAHCDLETRELTANTARFPFHNFEGVGHLRDYQCAQKEVNTICLNSGAEVTPSDGSIFINEDGETYPIDMDDYRIREAFNKPTGNRTKNRKRNVGNSTVGKSSSKKVKAKSPEAEQTNQMRSRGGGLRRQATEGRYTCTGCGKNFSAMSNLLRHERIHTGERPYQCILCGKSYNQKEVLLRHQKMHTGERPYQCSVCEKRFYLKHHLVAHQKIHSKANPGL